MEFRGPIGCATCASRVAHQKARSKNPSLDTVRQRKLLASAPGACLPSPHWWPKSSALMRTPNATEHNPSYDNEFLPVRPCVAGRRKSQIGVGWRATVDEMGNIRSPSRYDAGASCAL